MIHLICLGNPLHSDDGFGAAMAQRLGALSWPSTVRIIDGTQGGGVALFDGCAKAVMLQALAPEYGVAGAVLRLPADAVAHGGKPGGVATLLDAVARRIQPLPEIEVMGPVAALARPFMPGLSPLAAAAVNTVTAILTRELKGRRRHGWGGTSPRREEMF